jgi:hypothetical protein
MLSSNVRVSVVLLPETVPPVKPVKFTPGSFAVIVRSELPIV